MDERRKAPRLEEENEVNVTIVSGENDLPQGETIESYTKDVSVFGAKIQTNILLPVDSFIDLEFTSKGVREQIKTLGKVKWVNIIIEDSSYEAGVEFRGSSSEAIEKLGDYISWKLKTKAGLIKEKDSPIDSVDISIVETKELSPIDSDDISIVETKELPPIDAGGISIVETKELPPIDAGGISIVETKELSPIDSGDINIVKTKERPPVKSRQWIKKTIISLCAIILMVVLLNIFGFIPEFDRVIAPETNKKVTENFAHDSITTESAILPASPIAAPALEATPAPEATPAAEVKQKVKVVGNSDSKRYHLPGMKFYDAVKAYHRVEFDSEADAVKAGYNKGPQ